MTPAAALNQQHHVTLVLLSLNTFAISVYSIITPYLGMLPTSTLQWYAPGCPGTDALRNCLGKST